MAVIDDLISELQRDDLPRELQLVADAVGLEAVKVLITKLNGVTIYIRSPRRLRALMERYVSARYAVDEKGGSNIRELAVELGVSVAYVRDLLKSQRAKVAEAGQGRRLRGRYKPDSSAPTP